MIQTQEPTHKSKRRIDPAQIAALVSCGLLLGAVANTQWGSRSRTMTNTASFGLVPVTVPVTVGSGDSLWSLARRYGSPNRYILDRVDTLAQANHLSAGDPLLPGQRLLVPVENPVELARLQPTLARR